MKKSASSPRIIKLIFLSFLGILPSVAQAEFWDLEGEALSLDVFKADFQAALKFFPNGNFDLKQSQQVCVPSDIKSAKQQGYQLCSDITSKNTKELFHVDYNLYVDISHLKGLKDLMINVFYLVEEPDAAKVRDESPQEVIAGCDDYSYLVEYYKSPVNFQYLGTSDTSKNYIYLKTYSISVDNTVCSLIWIRDKSIPFMKGVSYGPVEVRIAGKGVTL